MGSISISCPQRLVFSSVKLFHKEDTGDHLFAAYITVTIYLGSVRIVRDSGFFRRPSLAEPQKYRTSAVTLETQNELA